MQPEHPPHQFENYTGSHGHWAGQRSREVAPSQPETVDSSWTPDLVWPLASEDTAFPFPSCPHSLSPSWIPGVVLSVGDPGECAAKKGHRHLLSLPKSVSVPGRRAGLGSQNRRLCSHALAKGKCYLLSFPKAVGFKEVTHAWTLRPSMDSQPGAEPCSLWQEGVRCYCGRSFLLKYETSPSHGEW